MNFIQEVREKTHAKILYTHAFTSAYDSPVMLYFRSMKSNATCLDMKDLCMLLGDLL